MLAALRITRPLALAVARPLASAAPPTPPPPPPLPTPATTTEADSEQPSWISSAPPAVQPYLRLSRADRPIGTWLLLWPCTWSIALAAGAQEPTLATAAAAAANASLFAAGAVVMRSAGCVVNDLWDRELDAGVERTKSRPLASGAVSVPAALAYLAAHGVVGLSILAQYEWATVALGASSLALVVSYPLMKRITYWPQAVLGLTFNWGVWLGYAAQSGSAAALPLHILAPLYASGVAWTLLYDTIYAMQDMDDDVKVGIKSSALATAHAPKAYLAAFAAGSVASLAAAGAAADLSFPFWAVAVGGGGAHLAWQVATLRLGDTADALAKFRSNSTYGALVAGGIVAAVVADGFL